MHPERQHVLIIDDEPQIRRFLRISLTSQGFGVDEAGTAGEGLNKALQQPFDLILLDLGLPDMDGQALLDRLRARSQVPVIVVSVRGNESEKVYALDHGANDYVTKPFGIQELLARIRALLRHQHTIAPSEPHRYRHGDIVIDTSTRQVSRAHQTIKLTPKEYAVLASLCRQPGRVVTQTQLLRDVWGPSHVHDTHYLRIVVSRLRDKLGDDTHSPRLLQTEAGIGYRLSVDIDSTAT